MTLYKNNNYDSGKQQENLSQAVIKGSWWLLALKIFERLFSFGRLVILARLLAPHDFGLMGIALLTIAALETFSQTGFHPAIIQRKNNTRAYLDTAWTISIIRGLALFGILYLAAPSLAVFFQAPEAKIIIQVIAFTIIIESFNNIGVVYFHKELKFNKEFLYQLSGTLSDFIVAVTTVLIFKNVWALILGLLAGKLSRLIVSYIIHPYKPRLSLKLQKAKQLFGFGKWIFGSSIVVFLATQGDDLFVSKALGITALGFYQMAFRLANLPSSEIGILSKIAFPAYAKIQDDLKRLKNAYLKTLRFFTFLAMPFAGGIIILSPQIINVILGHQWSPIIPALKILALSSLVRETIGTSGALFNAKARPDLDFKINLARTITLFIFVPGLTLLWGIAGTSLAILLALIVCLCFAMTAVRRLIQFKINTYLKILWPPLIATLIMIISIMAVQTLLNQHPITALINSLIIGAASFFACILLIKRKIDYPIFQDLISIARILKSNVKHETKNH